MRAAVLLAAGAVYHVVHNGAVSWNAMAGTAIAFALRPLFE